MVLNISATISQAISFLTRPLALIHAPAVVNAMQSVLRSTLSASALAASNRKLVLTFTVATPPRPVFAACIAVGIQWAEWVELLGNREFDLILDSRSLVVRYEGNAEVPPSTITLWTTPQVTPATRSLLLHLSVPQVPISKLGQQLQHLPPRYDLPKTPQLSDPPMNRPRTIAQELLNSDNDHEEANELFAMISTISTAAIISPTPTREKFNIPSYSRPQIKLPYPYTPSAFSPVSSPEPVSPESSRPSSRSSTFSTFSISDDESMTSATSATSSFESAGHKSTSSSTSPARPGIARREPYEPQVFIDSSKKNTTKYLYQGGVSSTLGGGVMLGRPSTAPKAPSPSTPKYRAPIGGKNKTGANAPSWRRRANPTFRA